MGLSLSMNLKIIDAVGAVDARDAITRWASSISNQSEGKQKKSQHGYIKCALQYGFDPTCLIYLMEVRTFLIMPNQSRLTTFV